MSIQLTGINDFRHGLKPLTELLLVWKGPSDVTLLMSND